MYRSPLWGVQGGSRREMWEWMRGKEREGKSGLRVEVFL